MNAGQCGSGVPLTRLAESAAAQGRKVEKTWQVATYEYLLFEGAEGKQQLTPTLMRSLAEQTKTIQVLADARLE
jgi:hypothetical protein